MQAHELADASLTRSDAEADDSADSVSVELRAAEIQVRYGNAHRDPRVASALLAAVHFGSISPQAISAPLDITVHLEPINGSPSVEYWFANGPVRAGQSGRVRYGHDDHFLFGVIEAHEQTHGSMRATTAAVYNEICSYQRDSAFPHLLRMWNYLDAINEGAGDLERYREFCVGRAHGLADAVADQFPAASGIGRQQATGQLQVFWLAGRRPGVAIENPRQVSAYRYPRTHGPASPSFSRATRTPDGTVLISGTASIVGHASQHHDDPLEQLEETLRNLEALSARSGSPRSTRHPQLLKVYVRDPAHTAAIARRLQERCPESEFVFLAGDICRRELLLEIEGIRLTVDG